MISNKIKNERINIQLTQKELADKIGMHEANYRRYELGTRTPTVEILSKIADVFDCSVDYLLGRTDKREVNR